MTGIGATGGGGGERTKYKKTAIPHQLDRCRCRPHIRTVASGEDSGCGSTFARSLKPTQ